MISGELRANAMQLAIDLARRGRRRVEPNPVVGAVVVSPEGEVVGRGHHDVFGGPHAEEAALRDAGEAARGATLVVTLEPCAHRHRGKKRARCVDLIREAGVAQVVFGADDPDARTTGRAARELEAAGIAVVGGLAGEACRALNDRFEAHLARGRPWVVAKWAMTLDGRIADGTGTSRWISGAPARRWTHELRAAVDAIVVGGGTASRDDPELTCRLVEGRSPRRVVVTSGLALDASLKLVATAADTPTTVFGVTTAPAEREQRLRAEGVPVERVPADVGGRPRPEDVLGVLHSQGVRRVLLEGGGRLLGAWWRAGVIDQVACFVAPAVVGGDGAPTPYAGPGRAMADALRLEEPAVTQLGDDALIEGFVPLDARSH